MKTHHQCDQATINPYSYFLIVQIILVKQLQQIFSCFILIVNALVRSRVARRCSVKGVLRNLTKFTGKLQHLCQSLFFNKVTGLRPVTLLKKRLWYRCFPANFAKVLKTHFLTETSGRLPLISMGTMQILVQKITSEKKRNTSRFLFFCSSSSSRPELFCKKRCS